MSAVFLCVVLPSGLCLCIVMIVVQTKKKMVRIEIDNQTRNVYLLQGSPIFFPLFSVVSVCSLCLLFFFRIKCFALIFSSFIKDLNDSNFIPVQKDDPSTVIEVRVFGAGKDGDYQATMVQMVPIIEHFVGSNN